MTQIAGVPDGPVALPEDLSAVLALLGVPGNAVPVWQNTDGGLTFRGEDVHVKWSPTGAADLTVEAARLAWAGERMTVPETVGHGRIESGTWLVTRTLAGTSAADARFAERPAETVRAVGAALRTLHDTLPVAECPFTWSVQDRLTTARARVDRGESRVTWHREHRHLRVAEALSRLANAPALDPVVCHGDACMPNTLLDDDGALTGHVDLGSLGVGDRWADVAVAAWSTEWNVGPGYEDELYAGYGITPDTAKIAYYRLLWDLS